jgi:quinoprotein glucose dehydrogenase
MVDGTLYLSTAYNRIVALDPDTGNELWNTDIQHPPATRGISLWRPDGAQPPRLVVATNDAYLMLLDLKDGRIVREFGKDGLVDLAFDVPEQFASRARAGRAVSSQPAIYKHLAITGNHPGESPSRGVSGDIHAWDLRTGERAWVFHTIPRPGEANHDAWQDDQWKDRGGANAWGQITIDEERGMAFVPLGTPNTDFYGGDRLGSNLYGSSLVALDANTGALKWYFQTTHHDNWDYDLSAPPSLIEVRQNGRTIPAVAIYTKQGLLFMFDRVTGKPIYDVEERPVASDNPLPGDVYWPTQPFPTKPRALARNSFLSADEVAKVTPEHEKACRDLLALEGGAMMGGPYAQYGPKVRVHFPGWTGGGNWNGHAWNPELGYLYFPSQDLGMLNKMVPHATIPNMWVRRGPEGGRGTNFSTGGYPCQQPPWGELIAVNVNTGDVAWHVPLGSFEELDKLGVPPTGTPNRGGPIATAGGLVFIGGSQDARFRAFDARTGKVLWTFDLSENGKAVPMTYLGKNGKQYVAILAAGGNPSARRVDPAQLGGRLYVFSLP